MHQNAFSFDDAVNALEKKEGKLENSYRNQHFFLRASDETI